MKWIFMGMAALFLLPGAMPEGKKKEKAYYVLLDRNSPGVQYWGPKGDSLFFSKETRYWEIRWLLDTLARHEEGIAFFLDDEKDYPDMIQQKHRSFLDSIQYFNEIWARDSVLEIITKFHKKFPKECPFGLPETLKNTFYLLDEGTIKNDSIMVYRTGMGIYWIEYD